MTTIRPMKREEWHEVASIIHDSTNQWYKSHYGHEIFTCTKSEIESLFCTTYEALDPDCCLVADVDGVIGASCFYHVRPTHYSLGIMNVHPDFAGKSLGRKLLQAIIEKSEAAQKPLRLVSSAMNLDSFSLYNKSGFQALGIFQDMLVDIPKDGLFQTKNKPSNVRKATIQDIEDIVALEKDIHGLDKQKDYEYFLCDAKGIWELLVYDDGGIKGALVSVKHPASNIVGHGIMQNEDIAHDLIVCALDRYRGMTPLILIPTNQPSLIQSMYRLGAKNCEIHLQQVHNPQGDISPKGVVLPTFMPENG